MYISVLQRNKKNRISLSFKRKVVEVFRAEIADAIDIKRCLKISPTKLRQWNRWYFKHRLDRHLNPKPKPMKTTSQSEYVRDLERRLVAAEKETKQL